MRKTATPRDGPYSRLLNNTCMKDGVKYSYMYAITGIAGGFNPGTSGLLRDRPDDSWPKDLMT